MKPIIPKEQRDRTIANIITVAAGMAMLALLIYFQPLWKMVVSFFDIISPFLLGGALAFLQIPVVRRIEWFFNVTICRRKKFPKLTRFVSTILSLLLLLVLVAGFLSILVPQVIESIKSLGSGVSAFIRENAGRLDELLSQYEFFDFLSFDGEQLTIGWESMLSNLTNYTDFIYQNVSRISSTVYTTILEIFVGLITAVYILLDKERFCAQAKKICYALGRRENCELLIRWMRRTNRTFAGFISGKIVDSLIIGVLCYFGMLLFRMEYPLLISVVVGVTNVIPYFGPFIGAIPSILILLIINPINALWFGIFIIVLQQIDGNVIGPLILGDSVGITPIWIMISIVVGSELFGLVGMLISVPVFAVLYALVKTVLESRLRAKGLPIASDDYMSVPESLCEQGPQPVPQPAPNFFKSRFARKK